MTADEDLPRVAFDRGDDAASIVARWATLDPQRIALIEGSRQRTWEELAERVDTVARALLAEGIGRARRVAVLSRNSVEYVELWFGALRAGASVVPLPTMASPDALALMLADCGAAALFVSSAYRASVETAIDSTTQRLLVGFDFGEGAYRDWNRFLHESGTAELPAPPAADDEFDVIYSSGTTGAPKGIAHSHAVRKASYAGNRARYFDHDSVNVVATPLYSNTTCVTWLLTTAAGGTNVILPKFESEAFASAVEEHRATHAMIVPVQYDRLLRSPVIERRDLSSLRYKFCTSAPLRAETKREILDRLPGELIEIYGTTEGGVVAVLDANRHPDKLASVGRPGANCEIVILDDEGHPLPHGRTGEVAGRCPNMMTGYVNRPEDTEALIWRDPEGRAFFKSGDIGHFDDDGFLYLSDRKKDVIISGGLNVYATDIEAVLETHEAVREVAVVGVPSEQWGEAPLACVVVEPGREVTADALTAYCNERVGKSQRVSGVVFHDELPKNPIGKVLKRELRAPYWS